MKVAIYIRVSTLDQAREGYSLDAQEKTLRKWCKDNKHTVHELYADRGISAKNIDSRPALRQLLQDAKEKKFDIILFWALSRFTRSVSDLYKTLTKIQGYDVSLVSYTESFDTTTPIGRAMLGIIGIFAQLERELISERVRAALVERASRGKRTATNIIGYDIKGDSMIINEKEAEYVRFCFEHYLIYKNVSEVARLCKEKGYRGKRGKLPYPSSINTILTNISYTGYNSYAGEVFKGKHEAIISTETFKKVQTILKRQGKLYGRRATQKLPKAS